MPIRGIITLMSFGLLTSCATPHSANFKSLKLGMDKAEVLELVGNPRASRRTRGQDEWTYRYYIDKQEYFRYLYFQERKLVDIGPEKNVLSQVRENLVQEAKDIEDYKNRVRQRQQLKEQGFKDETSEGN